MKTQVKKWGDSKVLVLTTDFLKFHQLEEGDWVDLSEIMKINKGEGGER